MSDAAPSAPSDAVECTLRIAARPETVWRYWTEPERMREWWGRAELEPTPGGICRVAMDDGPVMLGRYVEVIPFERVVFSFGWEGEHGMDDVPPESTRVEVTLAADGDGTVLTLRHTGLTAGRLELHERGWAMVLDRCMHAAGGSIAPG